jgi:hypothetical protein
MLHGCEIGDGSLIGIGSTILNGTKIGKNCLIGAHTLIPVLSYFDPDSDKQRASLTCFLEQENKLIPDNSMVMLQLALHKNSNRQDEYGCALSIPPSLSLHSRHRYPCSRTSLASSSRPIFFNPPFPPYHPPPPSLHATFLAPLLLPSFRCRCSDHLARL